MSGKKGAVTDILPPLARYREPYEKPEVREIKIGDQLDAIESSEGQLYHEFNTLADRLDQFIAGLEEFEKQMIELSSKLDQIRLDYGKAQFAIEASSRKDSADA